jgi:predicted signal transduction protein with EAL and GGDEF domain
MRWSAAIEEPVMLANGVQVRVGASLGLALCPADGRTASELVQAADQRMYANKAERKRNARDSNTQAAS